MGVRHLRGAGELPAARLSESVGVECFGVRIRGRRAAAREAVGQGGGRALRGRCSGGGGAAPGQVGAMALRHGFGKGIAFRDQMSRVKTRHNSNAPPPPPPPPTPRITNCGLPLDPYGVRQHIFQWKCCRIDGSRTIAQQSVNVNGEPISDHNRSAWAIRQVSRGARHQGDRGSRVISGDSQSMEGVLAGR